MTGDDRVRHCSLCRLNVYNLSGMSRNEAENLLRNSEGRLCVRYYERADGKVMTKDCPKGMALVRRRFAMSFLAVMTFGSMATSLLLAKPVPKSKFQEVQNKIREVEPIKTIMDKIDPPQPMIMGAIAPMPAPPSPAPGPKPAAPSPSSKA